jgi:hypothetical protein
VTSNSVLDQPAATVPDPWPHLSDQDHVRAIDVARVAGIPRNDIRNATRAGVLTPANDRRGRGVAVVFEKREALFLIFAALVARAVGEALLTVIRVLQGIGAPNALNVPEFTSASSAA